MDIVQPTGDGRPATQSHDRNEEYFARRIELLDRIAVLRAKAETGEIDEVSELALRRDKRELDDLTSEIMVANYGLVRRYVAMFTSRSSEHSEDFQSAGKVGLLWAICSYDPARGSFASWAFRPIQREVLRAVRDADHPNLNLSDFEKRPIILAAERALLEIAGADAVPDYAEIARRAGVTIAQVHRVLDAPRLESLHAPIGNQGEGVVPWEDRLADPSSSIEEQVQLRFHLRALARYGLPRLDDRELYVLTRRFGLGGEEEQPLRIIGEQLGLSREGVRQIQQKALAKLNEPVADAV
ncbi:sigma-70 family RNA polymerase sigma factor [Actinomadura darangshiensis]|uniref:Sigma-70 family RNA polymerase sigma factor n=1 Tax=Actinomadura darangshiensis TaxID=705336 RepID=A0A4R5BIL5_9ACTN|nr:sigma-70 family RNA polymerase sigma factor [Actinomadura darangshiensis]TDD85605.1 sigma-70 family RNA polymerase sigma factor [Actinomadura darangshiensis]